MAATTPGEDAPRTAGPAPGDETLALGEAARRLLDEGGEAARAATETALALRALAAAELDLARAAIPRALLLGALSAVAALSTLLALLALLALLLQRAGLDWPWALLAATLAGLAATLLLAWRARSTLRLAGFAATRRQLSRLGGDEA